MAEKGRSPAKPEKMEEKTGKVKPQNPQKLPSGVKKLFEIAQTGSAKELKAAFVKLPKEIVTELVWGLDWESETGLAVLGKMKKGGRAALKCCNDICCCRPFDIRWIRKCLDDPECVEALRELLRCLCGCCCCDFCWPPRLFCRCSCSVLVYPKDGVANSYVRTRKLRFSGANITANASNEAVITFPPGAGGNVDWADVQNTPASYAPSAHDIGGTGPHTGTLDNSQIPTTIHGRNIAADGANMDTLTSGAEIDLHSHATKAHDIGGTGPHTGTLDNSQIPTTIHGRDIAADGANMDTLTSGDNITLHTHPKITYREELSIPEHPGSAPIRVTFTNEWPDVNTTDVIVVASGYIEETDTTLTPLYITAKSVDKPATNFRLNLTVKDSDGNTYDPGDLMLWPMNRKLHFAVHVFA